MDPSAYLENPTATAVIGELVAPGSSQERSAVHDHSVSGTDVAESPSRSFQTHGRVAPVPVVADEPLGGSTKRALDLTLAVLVCLLLLPLIVTLVCLLRVCSKGPIFYAQARVGFRGRMFRCFKFRTMVGDSESVLAAHLRDHPAAAAEWAATRKLKQDPRITPIGRVLRLTSLDELPQLFNVLRGDMSLVGPRPVIGEELARYSIFQNSYLRTRPGLTGLWQVSGRSNCSYARRVELDRSYVADWSVWRDLQILVRTVPAVMRIGDSA